MMGELNGVIPKAPSPNLLLRSPPILRPFPNRKVVWPVERIRPISSCKETNIINERASRGRTFPMLIVSEPSWN